MVAALLLALVVSVHAVPSLPLIPRQSIAPLSTAQIDVLTPYAWYSSAAYCQPTTTVTWTCGATCEANPTFEPTASGGDGTDDQFWYVGYDPTLDTVIVAHEGTNTSSILSLLTDADFVLTPLDPTLFPGLPLTILVHNGFMDSHARAAPDVLAAVQATLAAHSTTTVTTVGHSLGAALATLDAVYLPLHLPSTITFYTHVYGLPRVGNLFWAEYVSANVSLTHVNNKEDPIPILPPIVSGYRHPIGEVHIEDSGEWAACPGMDNPSNLCIVGDVPTVAQGNLTDHDGPYNGVEMGC